MMIIAALQVNSLNRKIVIEKGSHTGFRDLTDYYLNIREIQVRIIGLSPR